MNKNTYIKIISLASVIVIIFFLTPAFTNAAVIKSLKGDGLVAWWTMDHNKVSSRIFDSSGNNVNGYFINGATTTYPGRLGQALDFDGTNDYVNLTTGGLGDTGSLSISVWVRPDSLSSTGAQGCCTGGTIIEGDNTGGNTGYNFSIRNDGKIWVWGSGGNDLFSSGSVPTGSWTHITYVYTGGNAKIYFNGVLDSSQASSQPSGHSSHSRIGHQGWVVGYFDGLIDDLRIYNRALQPSEIPNLMRSTPTSANVTPTLKFRDGLLSWWTMDGKDTLWSSATAGTVIDKSGNGNTGTISGMTRTSSPVPGKLGQGLSFNGSTSKIIMANSTALGTGDFSVSIWVNLQTPNSSLGIIIGNDPASVSFCCNWMIFYENTGHVVFYTVETPSETRVTGTTNIIGNGWHLITATRSGTTHSIYVDGVLESTTVGTVRNVTSTNKDGIANDESNTWSRMKGQVDDARIYNRALSASEVMQLYNTGVSNYNITSPLKNTNNLVGWWTMDGKDTNWLNSTTGTTTDKSGNGNTGTMTNMNRATTQVIGKIGQGMKFDGVNDYIDIGSAARFTTEDFSLSYWVKLNTLTTNQTGQGPIIFYAGEYQNGGWYQQIGEDGAINFSTNQVGVTQGSRSAVGEITTGKWYHIAFVRSGSSVRIYKNGIDVTSVAGTHIDPSPISYNSYIGLYATQGPLNPYIFLNGSLDDVRVYNRALSATEILQLYNQGK